MQGQSVERRGKSVGMKRLQYILGMGSMAAMLVVTGCRQDMHDEPKFFPQRGTTFYPDGRSVRPQVENTVARGQLHEDSYFYTGLNNGAEGNTYPFVVTMDVLKRGQERFNVYCTPCHSRVGNGEGMIVQRGYRPAGDFHTERLRNAPLGHFFAVMTNGYGAMPDYAAQVTPADRWAIVAYIRALQLSQNATAADVAGQPTKPLSAIADEQGLPPSFAKPWVLPATADVYGTPNNQDNGIPGQDKITGANTPGAATPNAATPKPATSGTPAATNPGAAKK